MPYDPSKYAGGDGSSFETAIKILADNSDEGVGAEYAYVSHHLEGCEILSQRLLENGDKKFDALRLRRTGGEEFELFFDITEFFGKDSDDWLEKFLE